MIDLFDPIVPLERRHVQYEALRNSAMHPSARKLINNIFDKVGDPNGTFVSDFQSHGFHGRLFELAAYAYLRSANLTVLGRHPQPDFVVTDGETEVAIEVTTSNPSDDADKDISVLKLEDLSEEEVEYRAKVVFPQRVLRSLKKKLSNAYQALPQVQGRPLVLMVAPYYEPGSVFFTDEELEPALYALSPNPKPTPFFMLPGSEAISAVVYCNSLTVPKFWRLADHELLATSYLAERYGVAFEEGDGRPFEFLHRIGHGATPIETWSEGVTIFHNPRATIPLPVAFLPASSRFVVEGEDPRRQVSGFHPLFSITRAWPLAEGAQAQV